MSSRPAFSRIASPATVHGLSICHLVLLAAALILTSVSLWDVSTNNRTPTGALVPLAISAVVLLVLFGINTIFQIYFGALFFYIGVENRDLEKTRTWFVAAVNLLALEILNVIFISFLAPHIEYFVSFAMVGIMYKFFQLWPADNFISDLESCLRPLMEGEAQYHI